MFHATDCEMLSAVCLQIFSPFFFKQIVHPFGMLARRKACRTTRPYNTFVIFLYRALCRWTLPCMDSRSTEYHADDDVVAPDLEVSHPTNTNVSYMITIGLNDSNTSFRAQVSCVPTR